MPQKLTKRVNSPDPLSPAPLNTGDGPIEKTPLQKRHRRNLTEAEKLEVAATRKRGACDKCRRKKEKACFSLPPKKQMLTLSSVVIT